MKPCTSTHEFPQFAVYDIETVKWENTRCVCHVDELGNRKVFTSISDYVDWLFDEFWLQSDMVWAHWGGRFDHNFALSECFDRGYTFEVVLSGNLMVVIEVFNADRRRIRFCESARIMPDSVEEIGKSVKLPKLDADRTDIENVPWDELVEYCYRDCDIVLKGLQRMRTELQKCNVDFAFTLASMATRWIRRSGVLDMDRFFEDDPTRKGKRRQAIAFIEADRFSYAAYKGGRTEMFAEGVHIGPFYYYDITSCYPAAMMLPLPAYFLKADAGCMKRNGEVDIERTLERCGTTKARVTIPAGSMQYPLLAFKFTREQIAEIKQYGLNHEGKPLTRAELNSLASRITYPEGQDLEGTWTNIELMTLWNHMKDVEGFELEIMGCAVYEPLAFMKPFVTTFWKMRQEAIAEGDAFKKYAYKILLNSASGKLAEQYDKVKVVHGAAVSRALKDHGNAAVTESSIPGIYLVHHQAEGAFRHAAAASYITAYGRIRLWQAMIDAERAGARVLYCDTDSVIVDKPIYGMETKGKELGAWHLEHVIHKIEIWGPKLYMYETDPDKDNPTGKHYRAKGMPIYRREDKGKPEVTHERWEQFTAFHKNKTLPKPTKEGIYGFLTVIGRAKVKNQSRQPGDSLISIRPRAFKLRRASLSKDTKRQHAGGTSKPLFLQNRRHDNHPKHAPTQRPIYKKRKLVNIPR